MHDVLSLLASIRDDGQEVFLQRYLHPAYAGFDYEFNFFDPKSGHFKAEKKIVDSVNSRSKQARYLRISFETLDKYSSKANRKNKVSADKETIELHSLILENLAQGKTEEAHVNLLKTLTRLAEIASQEFAEEQ